MLIEKSPTNIKSLNVIYVEDSVAIPDIESLIAEDISELSGVTKKTIPWDVLLTTQKWDQLFTMGMHEKNGYLITIDTIEKSRRGIATGANEFFHLRPSQAAAYGIRSRNQKYVLVALRILRG